MTRHRRAHGRANRAADKYLSLLAEAFAATPRQQEVVDALRFKVKHCQDDQLRTAELVAGLELQLRELEDASRRGALRAVQVNRIAALWRDVQESKPGARAALRDVIAILVERVIVRAEEAFIQIRPVLKVVKQLAGKPTLTGIILLHSVKMHLHVLAMACWQLRRSSWFWRGENGGHQWTIGSSARRKSSAPAARITESITYIVPRMALLTTLIREFSA